MKSIQDLLKKDAEDSAAKLASLFRSFRHQSSADKLVIFLGAGVSRLLCCWGWGRLATELLDKCLRWGILNHKEYRDHKKANHSFDMQISICKNLLLDSGMEDCFWAVVEKALKGKEDAESNIYKLIEPLNGVFVTTNYDEHFDRILRDRVGGEVALEPSNGGLIMERTDSKIVNIQVENQRALGLKIGHLYHLHGMQGQRQSMVLTTSDYAKAYSEQASLVPFLRNLFRDCTVLFLGYGVREFELTKLILPNRQGRVMKENHRMVEGFYSGDGTYKALKEYYKELSIDLIPYILDKPGHRGLYHLVKSAVEKVDNISEALKEAESYL